MLMEYFQIYQKSHIVIYQRLLVEHAVPMINITDRLLSDHTMLLITAIGCLVSEKWPWVGSLLDVFT